MSLRDKNSGRKDSLGRPIYESSKTQEHVAGNNKNALNPMGDFNHSGTESRTEVIRSEAQRDAFAQELHENVRETLLKDYPKVQSVCKKYVMGFRWMMFSPPSKTMEDAQKNERYY